MRTGGRLAAAIEVLETVLTHHRPAADALKDWGSRHRFAGSGDRAAIGNLVFDALRRRASFGFAMGEDSPRALVLATYVRGWGESVAALETAIAEDRHAPAPLAEAERVALERPLPEDLPLHVAGDLPEWLAPAFADAFGDEASAEAAALAVRAPVDLRVNTLKADREKAAKALMRLAPDPTPHASTGLRLTVPPGPARPPQVQAEAAFRKGWVEIQDEGSQLAALMTGAAPGEQVADLCAGAGGKTLALAAMMGNRGQIYAWDADRRRLANIHERLQRASVRNVQVREAGRTDALADLEGRMDLVLVDAPCTGTGTWRRRPDAKWRVSERALAERQSEQRAALEQALPLVRAGGRLAYVTCSVLPQENDAAVVPLLEAGFAPLPAAALIAEAGLPARFADAVRVTQLGLQMTPRLTGTDGFYVSVLRKG